MVASSCQLEDRFRQAVQVAHEEWIQRLDASERPAVAVQTRHDSDIRWRLPLDDQWRPAMA